MDLCLKGSQINLVARQKQKPKFSSQTNLQNIRPRSATFFSRRSRSSPFLYRPQSADPRFRRNISSSCGQYCGESDCPSKFNKNSNKRYQSLSSSDLLKLLLEEPIKRSWLLRNEGVSSPDDQSELSSSRRFSSNFSLNKRNRNFSIGESSVEGDNNTDRQYLRPSWAQFSRKPLTSSGQIQSNFYTASKMSNEKKSYESTTATKASTAAEFWHFTHNAGKSAKPDLPGRVSFGKFSAGSGGATQDIDSSDCDNDKQEQYYNRNTLQDASISAPGPAVVPQFLAPKTPKYEDASLDNESTTAALKKSVRFGANGGAEIVAETFEYPKCPSENCSCSTRSSSTASIHDVIDGNCACDSPTCKYAVKPSAKSTVETVMPSIHSESNNAMTEKLSVSTQSIVAEDLPVIREYKNAVAGELASSVVKNLLVEYKPNSPPKRAGMTLNNSELPSYLGKFKSEKNLEKQNNLSDVTNVHSKNAALSSKAAGKRNLLNELVKTENNLEQSTLSKTTFSSSSESVINNYLKVAAATTHLINKKKENKPTSSSQLDISHSSSSTSKRDKASGTSRMKSATASSSNELGKIKKSTSFGSLREDSNLNEFHLDKVDSWMSMHEQTLTTQQPEPKSVTALDVDLERYAKELNDREDGTPDTESQLSMKSDENSQDDSTYEEIVSCLKEIEEDKKKDNLAQKTTTELELKLDAVQSEPTPSQATEQQRTSIGREKSPDKYKDILNYLDNVEDSCDKTLLETRRSLPESNRSEMEFVVEPDIAEDVPKLSELLMLPNHQLARRVVALSLRANELANAVHLSKEHVIKIRTEKQKCIRSEKANSASRMREQKKHYEAVVTRHQGFIEQLLKDKGSLCEKVAALTRRLESQNQAWEHKLDTEIQKVKETTLAGEKIRRERWVRENTKKIKELTVKGLEIEINNMNNSHQRQITELKRAHQQELLDAVEEARLKHEQIENTIRETCAQDRESIIEKERTAIRERFERQLGEERKSFDEQKQKLCEEFAAERQRLQAELKDKEIEYQTKRQEMQREKELELEQTVAELQEKMSKQDEKYQNRINTIEKQYEADFELWKQEYENSCKIKQSEKENSIRQHYRTERDRQIDAIVSRMDAEALKNAEEFELKMSRVKEMYEKDLQVAEGVEKSLREKYTDARNRLAESDAQVRNYQAEMKQMQMELIHSKKMCSEYLSEREKLRENVRSEIQNEVATLKSERDNEIQQIHKRVQQAIEKKDATIELLQKESGALRERCVKLEAVIRQQRKDYCVK